MQPAFKSFRQIVKTLLSYVLSPDIRNAVNFVSTHFKRVLPVCQAFFKKNDFLKKTKI